MHWVMALQILTLLVVGFWMAGLPQDDAIKYQIYNMHKSFGIIAFTMLVVRIVLRLTSIVPQLPDTLKRRDALISKATLFLLYVLMLWMPLSGYLMSTYGGYHINFFGLGTVPSLVQKNQQLAYVFHTIHVLGGLAISGLIALHVLGFLKHLVMDRVNLLGRIL